MTNSGDLPGVIEDLHGDEVALRRRAVAGVDTYLATIDLATIRIWLRDLTKIS